MMPYPPAAPPKRGKGLVIALATLLVLLVVAALVVTLVIVPRNQQAKADRDAAVAAFNSASQACTSTAQQMSDAISAAQAEAAVDPTTLLDPSLIDKLNQAISAAQSTAPCAAPTMASSTAEINQQTDALQQSTAAVTGAVSLVEDATTAASNSAATLTDALTATPAASIVMTDNSGQQIKVTLQLTEWIQGSQTTWLDRAWNLNGGTGAMPAVSRDYALASGGADYYLNGSAAIYAIGTVTYTAVTPGITDFGSVGGNGSGSASSTVTGNIGNRFTCVNYSTPQCYADGPLAEPALGGDTWGPVTVVLAFDTYPSDPSTMTLTLASDVAWIDSPQTDSFTLKTTW